MSRAETAGHYSRSRVRASLAHFLVGRGVSALLGLGVAILIVRELAVREYAGYTALTGAQLLLLGLCNVGMERIIPRYFPELRQRGAVRELSSFCWRLLGLQAALLLVACAVTAYFFPSLARMISVGDARGLVGPFLLYVLTFGVSLHLQRSLQALLLQKQVSLGLIIEWGTKLAALLGWLVWMGSLNLAATLLLHGVTAGLGALYMGVVLALHLRTVAAQAEDEPPLLGRRQVVRFGMLNYIKSITNLHTRRSTARLLGAGLLEPSMVAALGVAYAAQGLLQRYLPAQLLGGLIEPSLVARYTTSRDFGRLGHLVSIVLKLNLFMLAPLAIWMAFRGGPLVEFITDGKYGEYAWLIGAFLLMLVFYSHGIILQLVINAVERSEILVQANLWSVLLVPLVFAGALYFGIAGFAAGIALIALFMNTYKVWRLRRIGYDYRPDWAGLARIFACAGAGCAAAALACSGIGNDVVRAFSEGAVMLVVFLVLAWWWKPFTPRERDTLNRFLGRPLCVF